MNTRDVSFIILSVIVVLVVWGSFSAKQYERMEEEVQKEINLFEGAEALFEGDWTYTPPIPEQIKKEACRASQACYMLSQALVYEARGESYLGALAVASVIMNRADHPNFPDTIEGVIRQPYQFSYLADMRKQSTPTRQDWDRALLIAYDVKHGIVERVTDALFYLNPKAVKRIPRWAREYQYVMTVDNHAFYKYN